MRLLAGLLSPFLTIIKNRELIIEMSKKEILDKYKGQPLGVLWAVVHPLVMILIYIFLFSVVYQTRINGEAQQTLSYAAYLLSGMVPWLTIQTALNTGSASITVNGMLIKQVIFPAEVLPTKMVGAAFIIEMIYIVIDLLYCFITVKSLSIVYLLLPVALLIKIIFLIGLNYMLAALNVYLRDTKDFVQVFCSIGVYLLPVIYSPDAVPAIFRKILYINPVSHIIWMFQDVLYYREILHWYSWVISVVEALVALYVGHIVFKKLKVGFGSVL